MEEISAPMAFLSADERLAPGYYWEPFRSVKNLIAHLGVWMAEAGVQLLDIAARSHVPHEVDVRSGVRRPVGLGPTGLGTGCSRHG